MTTRFPRIGITAKHDLERDDPIALKVVEHVIASGAECTVDARCAHVMQQAGCRTYADPTHLDLLIVVGGDGSILRAVRELPAASPPILGINRGSVGFLTELAPAAIDEALPSLLAEGGDMDARALVHAEVLRNGSSVANGKCLNEVVVSQRIARLLTLDVALNGEPLTRFQADGFIVASPTGSTAYSLAAGGPVVHPALPALILTPLNPYSFHQKPYVLPATSVLEAAILPKNTDRDGGATLTLDGQVSIDLLAGDRVRVTQDASAVRFLRRPTSTHASHLRAKLGWGGASAMR